LEGELMDDMVSARPTLAAWLEEYAAIEREFVDAVAAEGPVFAPRAAGRSRTDELREALRERGARFMNGGASVSSGFLSSACAACVGGCGSRTFYINLRCNRDCYFCFNPNQADFEEHCACDTPWREELEAFGAAVPEVTHIGLTGGEPLLCSDEALAFFARARELYPAAHLRLYTSGAGLDEAFCAAAAERGLDEVRFSVKLDEGEGSVEEVLRAIALTRRFSFDVMVEMPVVPSELGRMKLLLRQLDDLGVRGINLLELCYPYRNWDEFARRGLALKNPPFEVLYDYGYAGGLAVAGSEDACLELVLFAMEEGLSLGVHYCSLDNKNREQVLQGNRAAALDPEVYELADDCFYLTAKVFDGDREKVGAYLDGIGARYGVEDDCVSFHPARVAEAAELGALPVLSWNVIEGQGADAYVRELKLQVADGSGLPWGGSWRCPCSRSRWRVGWCWLPASRPSRRRGCMR